MSQPDRPTAPSLRRTLATLLRRHSLLLAASLGGAVGVGAVIQRSQARAQRPAVTAPALAGPLVVAATEPRREVFDTVQIALLLDTSSSMDGLINQARSQLWKMVNEIGRGQKEVDGVLHRIQLELALYEYGNSGLAEGDGFIRQVLPFSRDLDRVSEELGRLATNGGEEYAGQAIAAAMTGLAWSADADVLRYVFVAGNEGFDQGPVAPARALASAAERGVNVQLIHCGDGDPTWSQGAALARTDLLRIDQNAVAQEIAAPQDAELVRLGAALNSTYVPVGDEGAAASARQVAQDMSAQANGIGSAVARASVKASKEAYKNDSWDLVEASAGKPGKLASVKDSDLPAELRGLSLADKQAAVESKRKAREQLQGQIKRLEAERDAFVAAERAKAGPADEKSFDSEMLRSVKKTAAGKGYRF